MRKCVASATHTAAVTRRCSRCVGGRWRVLRERWHSWPGLTLLCLMSVVAVPWLVCSTTWASCGTWKQIAAQVVRSTRTTCAMMRWTNTLCQMVRVAKLRHWCLMRWAAEATRAMMAHQQEQARRTTMPLTRTMRPCYQRCSALHAQHLRRPQRPQHPQEGYVLA